MNAKADLINFRLNRAEESLALAKYSIEQEYWNSAASKLYYVCFYLIQALFAKNDIEVHTHSGTKTKFSYHFIKENLIEVKWGELFKKLFDKRQEGDYGDFITLTEEEILPYMDQVMQFKVVIYKFLEQEIN